MLDPWKYINSASENPPDEHEICYCDSCHRGDYHEDAVNEWAEDGCRLCQMWVDMNSESPNGDDYDEPITD